MPIEVSKVHQTLGTVYLTTMFLWMMYRAKEDGLVVLVSFWSTVILLRARMLLMLSPKVSWADGKSHVEGTAACTEWSIAVVFPTTTTSEGGNDFLAQLRHYGLRPCSKNRLATEARLVFVFPGTSGQLCEGTMCVPTTRYPTAPFDFHFCRTIDSCSKVYIKRKLASRAFIFAYFGADVILW